MPHSIWRVPRAVTFISDFRAAQNDKKDHGLVDELGGADYDALKHRRKFELQVRQKMS